MTKPTSAAVSAATMATPKKARNQPMMKPGAEVDVARVAGADDGRHRPVERVAQALEGPLLDLEDGDEEAATKTKPMIARSSVRKKWRSTPPLIRLRWNEIRLTTGER